MEGVTDVSARERPADARAVIALAAAAWLALIVGAFAMLWNYKSTPGATAPRSDWPANSHIARANDRATLIMFAHPYCPCTRASMNQLGELLSHIGGPVRAFVLFAPVDDEDVTQSALWKKAASISAVTPIVDVGGTEAALFGAKTSGHVMLFHRSGRNLFSGGITSARGHEGDNPGAQRVASFITSGHADHDTSPIFGCSLRED